MESVSCPSIGGVHVWGAWVMGMVTPGYKRKPMVKRYGMVLKRDIITETNNTVIHSSY